MIHDPDVNNTQQLFQDSEKYSVEAGNIVKKCQVKVSAHGFTKCSNCFPV